MQSQGAMRGIPTSDGMGGGLQENMLGNPGGGAGTMPPTTAGQSGVANTRNGVQQVHSAVIRGPAKGYGPRG
jgi:hypothetical protein